LPRHLGHCGVAVTAGEHYDAKVMARPSKGWANVKHSSRRYFCQPANKANMPLLIVVLATPALRT